MKSCSESSGYPWYDIVEENQPLNQGDIIKDCPIITPPREMSDSTPVEVEEYDVIVMSQSCDLENGKVNFVLTCPIYKLEDFIRQNNFYADKKGSLRQGNVLHYQMLHECTIEGFECEHIIVDFKKTFSIDFKFLKGFVKAKGDRKRLLPPYREWLSQMFARSYMRVGLPDNIPPFEDENDDQITILLKKAGAEKVSEDATQDLQKDMETWVTKIAKKTVQLVKKDGRVIVNSSDIVLAREELDQEE